MVAAVRRWSFLDAEDALARHIRIRVIEFVMYVLLAILCISLVMCTFSG